MRTKQEDVAYFKILNEIKEYYLKNQYRILDHHEKRPGTLYESYPFDWNYILNDVERIAWGITRDKGGIPLYPQWPLMGYFLDFANPAVKICVEIDGIKFHDPDKDAKRDLALQKNGWTTIRIPASKMVKENFSNDWSDKANIENWIFGTGDGILEAIKVIYFDGKIYAPESHADWFRTLCLYSIDNHIKYNLCQQQIKMD